jgi:hypothetical protein
MAETQMVAHSQPVNPMVVLQSALDKGATPEQLVILSDLADKWEMKQLKAAFDNALSRAQAKIRRIGVDSSNPQTHSKYSSYAKLDGAIRDIYTAEGLSLTFNTADTPKVDTVKVLCDVSLNGYTKQYQLDVPADGKGAKGNDVMTKTHATGSATSYGKRYLLIMIFNLAIGETDDDGNAAGVVQKQTGVDPDELLNRVDAIIAAADLESAKAAFAAVYRWATAAKDTEAQKRISTVWESVKQKFTAKSGVVQSKMQEAKDAIAK